MIFIQNCVPFMMTHALVMHLKNLYSKYLLPDLLETDSYSHSPRELLCACSCLDYLVSFCSSWICW